MKNEVKNNVYILDVYPRILCYLLEMKSVGYEESLINNIINLMEYNIRYNNNNCLTHFIPHTLGYNKEKAEYYDIVKKWIEIDKEHVINNRKNEIRRILEMKDWGMKFKEYCKNNKYEFQGNKSFFSNIDSNKLLDNIRNSDANNILEFIKGINNVYSFVYCDKKIKNTKKYYNEDIDSILNLKEKIIKIKSNNMEKGKIYIINELITTLQLCIDSLIVL